MGDHLLFQQYVITSASFTRLANDKATLIAIVHSILMTALVWRPMYTPADEGQLGADPGASAGDVATRGGALSVEETVQVCLLYSSISCNTGTLLTTQTVFDSFITSTLPLSTMSRPGGY